MKLRGPKPKHWRGRRNCDRCTRWRPVSDFTVYKTRTGYEQIKGECDHCKRERENARYAKLSEKQKRAKGIKANKQAEKRRNKALAEIERLHSIVDKQNETLEKQWYKIEHVRRHPRALYGSVNGTFVDIVPFRMWLLRQHRESGYNLSGLAMKIGVDEKQIRRWIDGFEWTGVGRDPVPIRTVAILTVDKIGIAMEDPGLLERLYPLAVDDD